MTECEKVICKMYLDDMHDNCNENKLLLQMLEEKLCEDAISRDAVLEKAVYTETEEGWCGYTVDVDYIKSLQSVKPLEPKTGRYEKHINHTDCIWYGSDSGCPVTCSQYRDGWNDAMDYIFKNGKGYQPYRHDG